MNILFRADSSSSMGTGHIMRDLVLAQKYNQENHNIIFATQDLQNNINNKIKESGYQLEIIDSNDADIVIELIKKYKIDLLVIDHYDIDITYETKIKENTDAKLLAFDDFYTPHNCDILLNHNACADQSRYKDLVPSHCELRCGNHYTLIREEFIIEKNKPKLKNNQLTIFIAMGGSDSTNINTEILKVLDNIDNITIDTVTTTANANLEALQEYCKNKKNITLHINTTKMAKLIHNANLAIITPSVTANEVLFMGTPFIAIKTVDNQDEMYNYLIKNNFLALEYFNKDKLSHAVKQTLQELL